MPAWSYAKTRRYAVDTADRRAEAWQDRVDSGRGVFDDNDPLSPELVASGALANFVKNQYGWFDVIDGVSSTWVNKFGYWAQHGQAGLAIQFLDGTTCWYPSLNYPWYSAMRAAASAGKFIHAYIYKKVGYQLIAG